MIKLCYLPEIATACRKLLLCNLRYLATAYYSRHSVLKISPTEFCAPQSFTFKELHKPSASIRLDTSTQLVHSKPDIFYFVEMKGSRLETLYTGVNPDFCFCSNQVAF